MNDVVVIGAGVMGASIAFDLARSGRTVIVVDKGDAVGGGSTSASAAIVRFNYSTIEGVIASWEAKHVWDDFAAHVGPVEGPIASFVKTGMLVFAAPWVDSTATIAHFETVGVSYEDLDEASVSERFPAIETGRFWPPRTAADPEFFDPPQGTLGALWTSEAGFIDDPQLAARNMMDAARREGAEVRLRTEVASIDVVDDAVEGVTLADGSRISAGCVINAAGPWSSQINALVNAELGLRIETRAMRQEIHSVRAPSGFRVNDGGTVIGDFDLGTYLRPHFGDTVLVGGVEAECDPPQWLDDADACKPSPSSALYESQTYRAARRVPEIEVPLQPKGLAAPYDVSSDWVPIYDRTDVDGYYVAIGTSGNQFKNAPIVGGIMMAIIDACEAGHDHDAEPVSYTCKNTGRQLGLGHYSRCRDVRQTSGTVMG